jgi:hypothetical protein
MGSDPHPFDATIRQLPSYRPVRDPDPDGEPVFSTFQSLEMKRWMMVIPLPQLVIFPGKTLNLRGK